ncbi:unnamed protein product [Rotaria sp. Silwood2]|nr:unnamed protein product [Rotaria sp. Silwood2]
MMQTLRRDYQRVQCVSMSKVGMTCRKISTILGISKSSVQRALKRYEETGDFRDRRRTGIPKTLNNRNIRMLKHLIQNDGRHYSARKTTFRFINTLNNPVITGKRKLVE